MTISVANVQSNQTFLSWLTTTNIMARIISANAVTADATTGGSITSGNAYVNGSFGANYLYANAGLVGGNVSTNGAVLILSNTAFRYSTSNLVTIQSNSTATSLAVQTNTVSIQTTQNVQIGGAALTINSLAVNVASNTVALTANGILTTSANIVFRANASFNAISITNSAAGPVIIANTANTTIVGNVALSNNLTVTGNVTFGSRLSVTNEANVGSLYAVGNGYVGGNLQVIGNLQVTGSVISSGTATSDILPAANVTYNLGNTARYWATTYTANLIVNNVATLNTATVARTLTVTGNATFNNTGIFTGNLTTSSSLIVANQIVQGTSSLSTRSTGSYTFTNSNTLVTIDSFATNAFRSVEYLIQTSDTTAPANSHQITKLLLVQDATTAFITEYATITTNAAMGIFNAAISAGTLNLRYTPVSNNVIVKFTRNGIAL